MKHKLYSKKSAISPNGTGLNADKIFKKLK